MESITDEVLASRVAAGDEQALALLVRRWESPLRTFILRRCFSCAGDIDDLLQETFLRVYRNIHDYDPTLRFSSWIFRIAHNLMVSSIRVHARREPPVDLDEAIFVVQGIRTDAELEAKDLGRLVHETLGAIPRSLREVFVLRFLEEKSYEEIGDILHRNANTVATQVRRSRAAFAKEAKARGLHMERGD